jgi:hypothetical protein
MRQIIFSVGVWDAVVTMGPAAANTCDELLTPCACEEVHVVFPAP